MDNYFANERLIAKSGGSIQARESHEDCPQCCDEEEDKVKSGGIAKTKTLHCFMCGATIGYSELQEAIHKIRIYGLTLNEIKKIWDYARQHGYKNNT